MTSPTPVTTDVLIVGAGPSGLALANVLAASGVSFRIVDRKSGPVRESRAAIIHVRTLELLDRLGLAGRTVAWGIPANRVQVYQRGRPAAEFPLVGRDAKRLTPFPYALILEQDRTEQLLIEGLRERGREVGWNVELLALTEGTAGVRAVVRRSDGGEDTILARWAVGADGASSSVRHVVGLGFAGKTYGQTGLLADVELELPAEARLDPGAIRLNLTRAGFVGMVGFSSGRYRLFGAVPKDLVARPGKRGVSHEAYARVSLADLQRWFDEYFFVPARLQRAEWTALYRIHSRIAERFRVGNVFLVGDAAHIHSPAGGQGMNLGIGDAVNLGWKLGLVAKGQADERLLDSYEAERYPVSKAVLRGSDRGFVLEATPNPTAEWARAHLAPRLIPPLLRLQAVQAAIFRLFSQTWISYRGSLAVGEDRGLHGRPRPGDRAPPTARIRGTGHSLLLFEGPESAPALGAYRRAVEDVLHGYAVDVAVHVIPATEVGLHRSYGATKPRLFLIRPDGHVEYRGSSADLDGLITHMDGLYLASGS